MTGAQWLPIWFTRILKLATLPGPSPITMYLHFKVSKERVVDVSGELEDPQLRINNHNTPGQGVAQGDRPTRPGRRPIQAVNRFCA